ncbi:MAG: solute carrier family 13 (sodium-dependent dicarboxylate transporter), member 2/3/5 [Verrucomicrobia bacterium]|nr:MAG: solute carrier family 13 (sodium-dependent dicarboxylate transporter), member 2/3/5 [Verrucomicrobiota bacterium]
MGDTKLRPEMNADHSLEEAPPATGMIGWRQRGGLIGGLTVLLTAFFLPAFPGLSHEASRTACLALAMAIFWITEALPIPATALLPLVFIPAFGIAKGKDAMREAAAPYADPVIFLFMGGFMLALAMERWNLHRRIALEIVARAGTKPRSLIKGFLCASAFVSMWTSNAATTMMLMPVGLSIHRMVRRGPGSQAFGAALVLAIAYGANIGGMGTLIGTPPNSILKGFLEARGVAVSFAQWMLLGVPMILVSLPFVYWILTRVSFQIGNRAVPGVGEALRTERSKLGPMSAPEWAVSGAFLLAISLWLTRELWKTHAPELTDEAIAMGCATLLFFIPADWRRGSFVLDWSALRNMPWDVLILFGGGLSLASAVEKTKLAAALATSMQGMQSWPPLLILFAISAGVILATALTSNTATTAAFLPVIAPMAEAMHQPALLFCLPVALAASADFALPVGTPPNAIAFGTGLISLPRMARTGIRVDLLFVVLIPLLTWTLGKWAFGL